MPEPLNPAHPQHFQYGRPRYGPPLSATDKYLAFQYDSGGLNNILMQFEIIVGLASLTGRTLILPPKGHMYLLGSQPLDLLDLFDRRALESHLPVLTSEEFCRRHGLPATRAQHGPFHAWMSENAHSPGWNAMQDAFAHPPNALTTRFELIPRLFGRRPIGITERERQAEILYLPTTREHRMFGVFEVFFLFADPVDERRARRLVRDAIRYHPDLLARAEQFLDAPPLQAQAYSAIHIRRGDFQYEETQISAESILRHTANLFRPGQTLYLATDESDPRFLQPFRNLYRVVTFDDLPANLVTSTPHHWKGIIETLLCAAAPERFVATRLSTFSARIQILRGHLSLTPDTPLAGIDTALYYTQPPLRPVKPEDDRPYSKPIRMHQDEFGETILPWWESRWATPVWGRAYQATWADAG